MNADQLRKDADTLDICQKAILQTYMSKTKEGVTEEEINNLINEETWMVGSDTTDYLILRWKTVCRQQPVQVITLMSIQRPQKH